MASSRESRRAMCGPSIRRRVHSPSAATSTMVVSVIAVRGSTYPSTPRRVATNCSRWVRSTRCEARSSVPRRAPPVPPRLFPRSRSNSPMAPLRRRLRCAGATVIIAALGMPTALRAGPFPEWQDEAQAPEAPPARAGRRRLHRGELVSSPTPPADLVILGGGSGGYAAAFRASELRLNVVLIEKDKVGGTCLHRGCIPTKALLHSGEVADLAREGEQFGVKTSLAGIDMDGVNSYKDGVISKLYKGLQGLVKAR